MRPIKVIASRVVVVCASLACLTLAGCGEQGSEARGNLVVKRLQDIGGLPTQKTINVTCPSNLQEEQALCQAGQEAAAEPTNPVTVEPRKTCPIDEVRYQIGGRIDGKSFLVQFDCNRDNLPGVRKAIVDAFGEPLLANNAPAQARAACGGAVDKIEIVPRQSSLEQSQIKATCSDGRSESIGFGAVE